MVIPAKSSKLLLERSTVSTMRLGSSAASFIKAGNIFDCVDIVSVPSCCNSGSEAIMERLSILDAGSYLLLRKCFKTPIVFVAPALGSCFCVILND
ncbi:hypothetical protein WICPIJ_003810 [Wickerhamomyces pijperi]|uniref:Uncharacterized protein n=1 Tax=Wickerhamomyces pijperi TaxID=599730 RepID=A0A9P8TND6_WICPI|nr:hypothetical protein WICPIJ_003810 [Wickerhamomyces pijperi]